MPPFDRICDVFFTSCHDFRSFCDLFRQASCSAAQFLVALRLPAMATEEASLHATREEMARIISALSGSGGNGLLEQIEGMSKRRRAEIDEEVRFCSPPPLCI